MPNIPTTRYEEHSRRLHDRDAITSKQNKLQNRANHLEESCASLAEQIRAKLGLIEVTSDDEKGWMLEVVAIVAVVALALEISPAHMMSLVFTFASVPELYALTAMFTVIGFLIGFFTGELMLRHKLARRRTVADNVFLALLVIGAVAFLGFGYQMRYAYAVATSASSAAAMTPVLQAATMTALAGLGILIAVIVGYYRESKTVWTNRRDLERLQRDLAKSTRYLADTRTELTRTQETSVRFDTHDRRAGDARYAAPNGNGAPSTNGVTPGDTTTGTRAL
jgi:hypothetical protein